MKHIKKFVVSIMLVLCMNFITPTFSYGMNPGGLLLDPIMHLLLVPVEITSLLNTMFIDFLCKGDAAWDGKTADEILESAR